jgi:hypothetical protein
VELVIGLLVRFRIGVLERLFVVLGKPGRSSPLPLPLDFWLGRGLASNLNPSRRRV